MPVPEETEKEVKAEKPQKAARPKSKAPAEEKFKKDREETLDFKKLARDERTWKIIGTVSLLISIFLFIAFISYFFTWKEDQDKVLNNDAGFLGDNEVRVSNLLGRLGAYISHFFIYRGFGIASLLFCTFFFVVGINLLFERKVFSIWRNLKYVTFGLLIASVTFAFISPSAAFPFGGRVGGMINNWLINFLGHFGTAALLLVVGASYLIWQFNPKFKMPERKPVIPREEIEFPLEEELKEEGEKRNTAPVIVPATPAVAATDVPSINDMYAEKGNSLKGEGGLIADNVVTDKENGPVFEIIERQEELELEEASEELELEELPEEEEMEEVIEEEEDVELEVESSIEEKYSGATLFIEQPKEEPVAMPEEEVVYPTLPPKVAFVPPPPPSVDLPLEIKSAEEKPAEEKDEREKGYADLPPYEPTLDLRDYKYPVIELLETHGSEKIVQDPAELEANKNQIINTLKNYDITIQKISATVGPTVTLYEIVPAAGVRISRIKNLEDDIALSLAALGIRIIAPIPGRGTIGIEVPNVKKTVVSMKTLLSSEKFANSAHSLPIAIGKKIDNENFIVDLATMPHLLMAGATGQGKSVGLNAILVSLLYKKHPSQLKFVLIDPKKVELSVYRHIERHFLAKLPGEEDAIITDTKKVINTLNALCIEMDNRYDLLKEAGARNIKEYNEKFVKRKLNPQKGHQYLPFIVLVVDEFADLIMTAGKEVEMPIARLAQLARAIGIHLIIATQRPSVNIITGTIKANFPARIAFKVSSKIDSRTILDAGGAEQLIGKGDMLISYNGEIVRLQCAFVDTPEVEKIVEFISDQRGYAQAFMLPEYVDEKELEKGGDFDSSDRDPLFEEAARLIVQNQVGSTSLIQRRMKLGYNRAGRLMDQLEAAGVVGPNQGSKAREVLIKTDADLFEYLQTLS
ncbi:cell division protein FtsK [Flavisolibacter tropicus]|uniref:Cell division protein FtsK n=1 Tax=Flavisolibacter tropicus TaxID=1492898 RepID=A0A172U1V4_9BACT|nr:cell division protein FtsK [Flavisolibacter tropicus]